jgi:hypothetical protein
MRPFFFFRRLVVFFVVFFFDDIVFVFFFAFAFFRFLAMMSSYVCESGNAGRLHDTEQRIPLFTMIRDDTFE